MKKTFPIAQSGVFPTLIMLALVLMVCSVLVLRHWPQPAASTTASSAPPLQGPGGKALAPLRLPAPHTVLYEQERGLFLLSTQNGVAHAVQAPGYSYNRSVTSVLTPAHEVIYSGDGIWITSLDAGHVKRLASLARGQVITSLALSSDGKTLAWSTAPASGGGSIVLYMSQLNASAGPQRVYEQAAARCPCLRIFAFLSSGALLLTDDRGDHRLVRYGLWLFDPAAKPVSQPRPLLPDEAQQGPLLLSPQNNTLLYSSYEGFAPMPDSGVPADITSLNYANSLLAASIHQPEGNLQGQRVLLPEQQAVSGPAAYRWIATPQLSPDGQSVAYAEFSSADRLPFTRHYALYSASMDAQSKDGPRLLATANTPYIESGPWLDAHTLTFYADNALYALDTQQLALTTLGQTTGYARIVSVVE